MPEVNPRTVGSAQSGPSCEAECTGHVAALARLTHPTPVIPPTNPPAYTLPPLTVEPLGGARLTVDWPRVRVEL